MSNGNQERPSFDDHLRLAHSSPDRAADAAGLSTESLQAELEKRQAGNVFPLDVFHPAIKPYLTLLHKEMNLPRSFIGLSMLMAYSTAIGTGYAVESASGGNLYMPLWGCLEGISSSGKSLTADIILDPIHALQREYDREWNDLRNDRGDDFQAWKETMKQITFRDVHISTLVRSVMPDNPKGMLKLADEIMEFINGMNQLSRKEGTDEQFWLSAWDCRPYTGIRSGKDKFVVERPYANVLGGIQPTITWKLFKNDRDTTGFIFRFLFAVPEEVRIAQPNSSFVMPKELRELHFNTIQQMARQLNVENEYQEPKKAILTKEASQLVEAWRSRRINLINRMDTVLEKDIHSGVLGKMSNYAKRFAGLLLVADLTYGKDFYTDAHITADHMQRALRLADYFYDSAILVYERVNESIVAPAEVLRWATYVRSGFSMQKIGDLEFPQNNSESGRRVKASRELKKMIKQYPRVFNAQAKYNG